MRPIRIAAQLHPQHGDYAGLRAGVLRAEGLGYDLAYTWDHFFPLYGTADAKHLECWTLLAAWAEATDRIELGPLVSCVAYRNPDLVADMARTIDRISDGRFVLGLGSGWFRRDFDEYGYDFGTAGSRLRGLEAALARIRTRLDDLDPPPVRRPPILIAGVGERVTLRLVAEHADTWHAGFPDRPSDLEPTIDALERWCASVSRDPTEIERAVGVEPDDLDRVLVEEADTYRSMGFSQFTLGFNGPGWDVEAGRRWLAWRDTRNGGSPVAERRSVTRGAGSSQRRR